MTEYMHLVGAEQVTSAIYVFRDAVQRLEQALAWEDENRQRWLVRYEEMLERARQPVLPAELDA